MPDYPDYRTQYECRSARHSQPNSDSDDTEDSLDPDYARPYQHLPYRGGTVALFGLKCFKNIFGVLIFYR
jgi:hypothetical protein